MEKCSALLLPGKHTHPHTTYTHTHTHIRYLVECTFHTLEFVYLVWRRILHSILLVLIPCNASAFVHTWPDPDLFPGMISVPTVIRLRIFADGCCFIIHEIWFLWMFRIFVWRYYCVMGYSLPLWTPDHQVTIRPFVVLPQTVTAKSDTHSWRECLCIM